MRRFIFNHRNINKKLIFQPIIFLIIGPPVWRLADSRNALASLKGEMDVWVIFQILVYSLAGLLSLLGLLKHKNILARDKKLILFLSICAGLCVSLYLSSLISPSPSLTFTYSSFYLIGITSSLYFILQSESYNRNMLEYFSLLRILCLILLILVAISYAIDIQFVGLESYLFGLRILGGRVASSGISALILYTISLHFLLIGFRNFFNSIVFITIGLIFIFFSKTRGIYLLTIVTTYVSLIMALFNKNSRFPVQLKPVLYFILPTLSIFIVIIFKDFQSIVEFLIRYNIDSFKNFGGRLLIAKWIIDKLIANPWGLGYVAGFRNIFLFEGQIEDVIAQRIGTAHNSYLEIMIGAGWPAIFFFLIILGTAINNLIRVLKIKYVNVDIKESCKLGSLLLGMIIVLALIDSKFVLPTRNEFGFFWYIIGLSFIISKKALDKSQIYLS